MGKIRGQVLGPRWVDVHRSHPHHGVALPPPLADLVGAGPAAAPAAPAAPPAAGPAAAAPADPAPSAEAWDQSVLAKQVARLQQGGTE
eukprot:14925895-Alexandrium_andersonii.AAC.1